VKLGFVKDITTPRVDKLPTLKANRVYEFIGMPKYQLGAKFIEKQKLKSNLKTPPSNNSPSYVLYNTPEYNEAYKEGTVTRIDPYNEGTFIAPEMEEITVKAPNLSLKKKMFEGHTDFIQGAAELSSQPQKQVMEQITGTSQTPSEAWGFKGDSIGAYVGNTAIDMIADPVNLLGVGAVSKVGKISKGMKNILGTAKKLAFKGGKEVANTTLGELPGIINYVEGNNNIKT
jgi:hypothetical protein